MDIEPPTGDDLAKMIVTIKENTLRSVVVETPTRPRFRFGLIVGIVAAIAVGTASSAVALGLVPQPFAAPAPSAPPTPSITPTPTPTVTAPPPAPAVTEPTAGLTVPATCDAVVAPADATRLFKSTPFEQLRPVASGATAQPVPTPPGTDAAFIDTPTLYCIWRDPRADISGLSLAMGTGSSAAFGTYMAQLAATGYTCTDAQGGRSCQRVTPVEDYPVDTTSTFFVLGDTWVEVSQTNFPTSNLLGAITEHLK